MTSGDDDEDVILMAVENPFFTINDIYKELEIASYHTIRNRLIEHGFKSSIAAKKTLLNQQRKLARLQYCVEMQNHDWMRTVFVDESHFSTAKCGPKHVLRPRGTRFEEIYLHKINFSQRFTVSVFGMISSYGFGPLVRVEGRCNSLQYVNIIRRMNAHLTLFFPHNEFFWCQDNAPIHNAFYTREFMQSIGLQILPHPPYSPDLNPIENVWGWIKMELAKLPTAISADDLFNQLELLWNRLKTQNEFIRNLYLSMPNRVNQCILKTGGMTKY